MCYKYYTQEVDCPRDGVEEIPIQFKKTELPDLIFKVPLVNSRVQQK